MLVSSIRWLYVRSLSQRLHLQNKQFSSIITLQRTREQHNQNRSSLATLVYSQPGWQIARIEPNPFPLCPSGDYFQGSFASRTFYTHRDFMPKRSKTRITGLNITFFRWFYIARCLVWRCSSLNRGAIVSKSCARFHLKQGR